MKHFSSYLILSSLLFVACSHTPVANPDPNHTHADFAVWIDGKQLDFSGPEFMSGTSDEKDPDHTKHDKYLHLHDGNVHVIHRHKPGLTTGAFFVSNLKLNVSSDRVKNIDCLIRDHLRAPDEANAVPPDIHDLPTCISGHLRAFVNGTEMSAFDVMEYVFQDGDKILLTTDTSDDEVLKQLSEMTDDACMYSKTCPWKGEPPTENCIADPEVPCVSK